MRIVVIMDPVRTVQVDADTSFALMLAAQARGHRVDHCLIHDVFLDGGRAGAHVRQATMDRGAASPVSLGAAERVFFDEVDAVLVRKDPPFDSAYLYATLVLERAREQTFVVNDPRGLRDANEKIYAANFAELMPATLVSSNAKQIREFTEAQGGRAVLKPLDGAGGEGVFLLDGADLNFNAIVEALTKNGSRLAMAQRFLPAVSVGDKRILLLDGEPLGAILRVPAKGDVRSNIHVGGSVVSAKLDEADQKIIATVAPRLRKDGLYFVGLDVIGGHLTEVNVTSPTGIQQMERLDGVDYSARVLTWLESRVAS